MRDPTSVDNCVFDSLDTRYSLPSRGVPDERCSPFDFCVFRMVRVGPETGLETRFHTRRPAHLEVLA